MMHTLGHEVILYSGMFNEAPCDEHIPCISERNRAEMVGDKHYTEADWNHSYWQIFNNNVITEMKQRLKPQDFICLIGGLSHKPIADAFPNHVSVEFGIGYSGTFAKYRVFESYAWMHSIYAQDATRTMGGAHSSDGNFFDAVIPNQFDPRIFYSQTKNERTHFLYAGRKIARKGISIAQQVCQDLNVPLIMVGPGIANGYGTSIPAQGPEALAELMRSSIALFAPTLYIEPFGTVSVEAMACGTPIICTDWGVFTETVREGVDGWRCRMYSEFKDAVSSALLMNKFDREEIADNAINRWSMRNVAIKYEEYFTRLNSIWGAGWYA
jgi:glycosyltransferase involved in cell wall biosynthesis